MDRRRAGSVGEPEAVAAAARAWVDASCAAQGIPVKVNDPAAVLVIAALLPGRAESAGIGQRPSSRAAARAARRA